MNIDTWKLTRPLRVIRYRWRKYRGKVDVYEEIAYAMDVPRHLLLPRPGTFNSMYAMREETIEHINRQYAEFMRDAQPLEIPEGFGPED